MKIVTPEKGGNMNKQEIYDETIGKIEALLLAENDWISAMATVVCESFTTALTIFTGLVFTAWSMLETLK